jgi:hypothetical protein
MTWNELYPVVAEQAKYAVLRYDQRRQDKVQELVCQVEKASVVRERETECNRFSERPLG